MKITRRVHVSIIYLALAIGMLVAPATAISLATAGAATAAPTTSITPLRGHGGHGGGHGFGGQGGQGFGGQGFGSGGAGVGAPSTYGRGHDERWVYGPVLDVPHVDTTVHQSR